MTTKRVARSWERQIGKVLNISRHRVLVEIYADWKRVDVHVCAHLAHMKTPRVMALLDFMAKITSLHEGSVVYVLEFWNWRGVEYWTDMFPASTWGIVIMT